MVTILMMSAKKTIGLLKTEVFWSRGYDVIIYVHYVPTKIYHVTQIIL